MRSLAVFGTLTLFVWLSLLALLYVIDVLVMAAVKEGWARSVLGLAAFALWVAGWYRALLFLSKKLIERWAHRVSSGLQRSGAR